MATSGEQGKKKEKRLTSTCMVWKTKYRFQKLGEMSDENQDQITS